MTKKIISFAAGILCGCFMFVGSAKSDSPGASAKGWNVFSVSCPSSGLATVTSTSKQLYGYVDGIYLYQSGTAGQTTIVSIATTTTYGSFTVARTLFSTNIFTTTQNGYYPIRQQATDNSGYSIGGEWVPYTLIGETVTMSVTNFDGCIGTGVTVRAVLLTSP